MDRPASTRRRFRAFAAAAALAAALVCTGGVGAQDTWRDAPAATPVKYTIKAQLVRDIEDEVPRRIQGSEDIVWTNHSSEPVGSLWFHLYPNAFANERSAFLRERAREGRKLPDKMVWGGCEILGVEVVESRRQLNRRFVPFPDAPDDQTVMRVDLPQPVDPGAQVTLHVNFTTTLPTPVARMGALREFVMAGQWFPKLGRHLGKGAAVPNLTDDGWYCPHYHATSEFAADFGDYAVTLTTPKEWVVGATGVPEGDPTIDPAAETQTQTFVARNVVDFAWTAGRRERLQATHHWIDPDGEPKRDNGVLVRVATEVQRVRALLGESGAAVDLPQVEVVLLLQREHEAQRERYVEAAHVALALYGTWLGPYPYQRLTIVDPPHDAAVGGMEYPTLVTGGTTVDSPRGALRPEHVTVHEIGHQWFMNLLASNEAEEAWLDEGLNTWFTARAMAIAWGAPTQLTSVLGLHFRTELPYTFPGLAAGAGAIGMPAWSHPPALEGFRLWRDAPMLFASQSSRYIRGNYALPFRRSYVRSGAAMDEMVKSSWDFASADSYRGNAYPRGALLLETIDRHVRSSADAAEADRRILRAYRAYARQFRFAHPTTQDLVRVLQHELSTPDPRMPDMRQLFDTLARTTGLLDYAVGFVRVVEEPRPGAPRGEVPPTRSTVRVVRRGEVVVPVTVRIELDGGQVINVPWDGAGRYRDIPVDGRVRVVQIDPDQLFPQDARLSDNVWTDGTSLRPAVKWGTHAMLWLEHAITAYGRFF